MYVHVCRKTALPTVTSCLRIHAAAANVLAALLHRWVPTDLGGGGDLQESPTSVNSLFPFFSCRKAPCPAAGPRLEGCCGLADPLPPPPRRPSRLTAQLPARPERGEAKAAGLGAGGGGRLGSPAAKLSARPAAAARVAPRAEPCCAAGQSLRGRGGAPRPDRPWERGGTRRRLGGNHRGNPAEDAPRTKMCLQWRAPAPRAAAARGSGAPAAVCASEEREELPARPRSAQKVEKNMD